MPHPELINKMILLVEDDGADADLAQEAFQRCDPDFRFHVVTDGQAAIDYLLGKGAYEDREKFPYPALMLLDMKMPRMDGKQLLAWLEKHSHLPPLWVTILSGASLAKTANPAVRTFGNISICHGQFLKPLDRELAEMIISMFELWDKFRRRAQDPSLREGTF